MRKCGNVIGDISDIEDGNLVKIFERVENR